MSWRSRFESFECLWGGELLQESWDVAYLVRAKNEGRWIGPFLHSLHAQENAGRALLIVLDSGSSDDTLDQARHYPGPVCCCRIAPSEFSFGDTCNLLLELARAELVMLLSAHVILSRTDLVEVARRSFVDPRVAGVSFRQVPHRLIGTNPYEALYLLRNFPATAPTSGGAFSNAGSMLRKSAWQEVPFRSVGASEDAMWASDVAARGWRVLYLPELAIEHSHNESPAQAYRRVRINKVARFGTRPQWLKASSYLVAIFGLLLRRGESPRRAFRYAAGHAAAYAFAECPTWLDRQ